MASVGALWAALALGPACGSKQASSPADAGHDVPAGDAPPGETAVPDAAADLAADAVAEVAADRPDEVAPRGPCTPPANLDQPMEKLSQTGCVDPAHPTMPAALVIPYQVQSPLWADGADLRRGFALPVGAKIHILDCALEPAACPQGPADTGKWVFPIGTVLIQDLSFDGKLVDTRLLARADDGSWVGYSYRWDEAQTDATVVPDAQVQVTFATGQRSVDWRYLNRLDCVTCHNPAAGSTLGPETAQMDRMVGGTNQIDRFAAMGLFDAAVAARTRPALVTPYAGQAGTPPAGATAEDRARSYLHANCAFCHRPAGGYPDTDFRRDATFKEMNLCGVTPGEGDLGVPTSTRLTPAKPMESVIWLRMNALPGGGRMPRVGSYVVDQTAVALVGSWINSIASCPP